MRTAAPEPVPPGWYQAPGEAFVDRYWDGTAWTDRSRARPRPTDRVVASPWPRDAVPPVRASTWVAAALGAGLVVAGAFLEGRHGWPSGLLASGGAVVLGTAGSLLRWGAGTTRAYVSFCSVIGIVILGAGTVAALTGDAVAWLAAAAGLVLAAVGVVRLLRPGRRRR